MRAYSIDDVLKASDRRREHDYWTTRRHLEAGERDIETFGYCLEAWGGIIRAQPEVRPDVARDQLPEGAEAYDPYN